MDNLQRRIQEKNKRSAKLLGLMKAVGSCFHLRSFFSTPSTGGIIFFTLKLAQIIINEWSECNGSDLKRKYVFYSSNVNKYSLIITY